MEEKDEPPPRSAATPALDWSRGSAGVAFADDVDADDVAFATSTSSRFVRLDFRSSVPPAYRSRRESADSSAFASLVSVVLVAFLPARLPNPNPLSFANSRSARANRRSRDSTVAARLLASSASVVNR